MIEAVREIAAALREIAEHLNHIKHALYQHHDMRRPYR